MKEVYTYMPTPFALESRGRNIKTKIDTYERVDIGSEYYGLLFYNAQKKLWHIALEEGTIIGTMKNKTELLKRTRNDVATADPDIAKNKFNNPSETSNKLSF